MAVGEQKPHPFALASFVAPVVCVIMIGACGRVSYDELPGDQYVYTEAETGTLVAPMQVNQDPTLSGGAYIIDEWNSAGARTEGAARYTVVIPRDGDFVLWGYVNAPTPAQDSFFVSVNGGAPRVYHTAEDGLWDPAWQWTKMRDVVDQTLGMASVFSLNAGENEVEILSRESLSTLDRFLFTTDVAFVP